MSMQKSLACVTGGTGMVGREVVRGLLAAGYNVRVISRQKQKFIPGVEFFIGDLTDKNILESFLNSAEAVFHCAAELNDPREMYRNNVVATENLLASCEHRAIKYFCFISSAGVIGLTDLEWVTEDAVCNPQNEYERTKYLAETSVMNNRFCINTVVLRPTNVINFEHPGAFLLPIQKGFLNRVKVFVKGGECVHLVHAQDVANAALFFLSRKLDQPECFFVGNDEELLNTLAGIWSIYDCIQMKGKKLRVLLHFPSWVPVKLRRIFRGHSNGGNVRYSSDKLRQYGFKLTFDLNTSASELVKYHG